MLWGALELKLTWPKNDQLSEKPNLINKLLLKLKQDNKPWEELSYRPSWKTKISRGKHKKKELESKHKSKLKEELLKRPTKEAESLLKYLLKGREERPNKED